MESPLLTKSEHSVNDVTIHGDSSSNDEHTVDITIHGDSSSNDEHTVDITIHGDSSSNDEHTVDITIHGDSSSADEQTPSINGIVWILVELAVTLVQIVAAIFFLNLTKDEQIPKLDHVPVFIWIICYTCASITTFPVVCWRLFRYIQNASSETRISKVMDGLEKFLEGFFSSLVVMFLWYFFIKLASRDDTTQHFWLWLALFSFSCIRYVLPRLQDAVSCFECPLWFVINLFIKQLMDGINNMVIGIARLFWFIFYVILGIFGCIFMIFQCIFGCDIL